MRITKKHNLAVDRLQTKLCELLKAMPRVSILSPLVLTILDSPQLNIGISLSVFGRDMHLDVKIDEQHLCSVETDSQMLEDITSAILGKFNELVAPAFYYDNYEIVFRHSFEDQLKILSTTEGTPVCRFCKETEPISTFHDKAHAIPECIGNKNLFTKYECDKCNKMFGIGMENQFGSWSNLERTLFLIKGKKGIPNFEEGKEQIEYIDKTIKIKVADETSVTFDNENSRVELTLTYRTFIPEAVLKTFHKMALSVMPDSEMGNFQHLLPWIRLANQKRPSNIHGSLFSTFHPAPQFQLGNVVLLKRRSPDLSLPYMTFVLSFGKSCYQLVLSSCNERESKEVPLVPFFNCYNEELPLLAKTYILDFSSDTPNNVLRSESSPFYSILK
ncbi:MAG: HNH endonuclease [Candidatus Obscuribacterales bacterium]|nr:HNH endonuclease [Candidatus Obscuribacterales bacterium]